MSQIPVCQRCAPRAYGGLVPYLVMSYPLEIYCMECGFNQTVISQLEGSQKKLAELKVRSQDHGKSVATLLGRSFEIVNLIVGPEKVVVPCHKVLLGFFCRYFEPPMYHGFAETGKNEMCLPKDDPAEIKTLVLFLVSGVLNFNAEDQEANQLALVKLWILGDKLLCPTFSNKVMEMCLPVFHHLWMAPDVLQFILENTMEDSKLRLFALDEIRSWGPLNVNSANKYTDQWLQLMEDGGEIAREITMAGGLHGCVPELVPNEECNHHKYFVEVDQISAAEWRKGMPL